MGPLGPQLLAQQRVAHFRAQKIRIYLAEQIVTYITIQ